ncbi:MAG: hypothetical protein IBJ17_01360 [Reyranella sp.]|nr:hypothetical protein [Reyranella sp.]
MSTTYTCPAYMWSWETLDSIKAGKKKPYVTDANPCDPDMVRIGTARVTVTFDDPATVQRGQIDALNEKLAEVRAENQQRENAILDRISKLQALEFSGVEA